MFFASNPSGQTAAIKLIERTSKNHHAVDDDVQICKDLTAAAERFEKDKRILRVVDVLYTKDEKFSSTTALDSVAIVLAPVTRETLANWVRSQSMG